MEEQKPNENNLQNQANEELGIEKESPKEESVVPPKDGGGGDSLDSFIIPELRTYKEDVKQAVQSQNISTARILLQEQKKKAAQALHEEQTTLKSTKNKFFFVGSLILIALAGGIVGYFIFENQKPPAPVSKIIIKRPEFIEIEAQNEISVNLKNKRDILNEVKQFIIAPIEQEKMNEILLLSVEEFFLEGKKVENKTPIDTTTFFELVETRAPGALIRSLGDEFMLGVYGINVGEPFILFKVEDFENTFGSMLEWEPLIARDIQPIFFINYERNDLQKNPLIGAPVSIPTTATTSTSTEPVVEAVTNKVLFDATIFSDLIIENRDARVIKNEFGEVVFFYTFIDDEHLLFATKGKTLAEVIRRLRQAKLIR